MLLIIMHRLLQSFALPPLNAMIIIVIGIILSYFNVKKLLSTFLIWTGIIFLYIQSTPFFAYHLTKLLEIEPITQDNINNSQAIIILGGGVKNTGYEYDWPIVSSNSTLVRLSYAAFLAKQYPDKLIITSGGYVGPNTEAKVMRDTLINNFNVKNTIIMEQKSRNTAENAKFVAQILKDLGMNQVTIVTQAFHARRANALFRKQGVNSIVASTDYYSNNDALTSQLAFIPNAHSMQITARTFHEILGYLLYIKLGFSEN